MYEYEIHCVNADMVYNHTMYHGIMYIMVSWYHGISIMVYMVSYDHMVYNGMSTCAGTLGHTLGLPSCKGSAGLQGTQCTL